MPIATYKALCIDAVDVDRIAAFWAAALGLEVDKRPDGIARLAGPTSEHTVWVNPVPEPVTTKQRAHLDVTARSVDDVLDLGATPVDLDSFDWKVVRDPEGGELCVFERDEEEAGGAGERLLEVVVDRADPRSQAEWWADVLQAQVGHDERGRWSWVEGIAGTPFRYLVFVPVPEAKTVKNRVHLDLESGAVPELVGRGAVRLREPDDEIHWTVLADPEGNEFCAFEPIEANDDVTPLPEERENDAFDPLIGREEAPVPPTEGVRPVP